MPFEKNINLNDLIVSFSCHENEPLIHSLSRFCQYNYSFSAHTALWIELALTVPNNQLDKHNDQYYELEDFLVLLNEGVDLNVFSDEYVTSLQGMAKKSGRLLEFCYLLNYLEIHGNKNFWESTNMIYKLIYNAFQQHRINFSGQDFCQMVNLMADKICLLSKSDIDRLELIADLRGRLPHFYKFKNHQHNLKTGLFTNVGAESEAFREKRHKSL